MPFLNNEILPSSEIIKLQLHTMYESKTTNKQTNTKNNQPKCVASEARFKLMHMYEIWPKTGNLHSIVLESESGYLWEVYCKRDTKASECG